MGLNRQTTKRGRQIELSALRFLAGLTLLCACVLTFSLPAPQAATQPESVDRSRSLKSLARDLSELTKEQAKVLAVADKAKSAAGIAQSRWEIIAGTPGLNEDEFNRFSSVLHNLAYDAPDLYGSLLAVPSIRERLLEVEKAFRTPIFADIKSNAKARELLEQLQILAQDMVVDASGAELKHQGVDGPYFVGVRSKKEFDAALKSLDEALRRANEIPLSAYFAPYVLTDATKFLHVHLISEAKNREIEFAKGLQRYLGGYQGEAYHLFQHIATLRPEDAGLAVAVGEIFLQTHCKSAESAGYDCLTARSLLLFQYHTLHDQANFRKSRTALDDAFKRNKRLRLALSLNATHDEKIVKEPEEAVSELRLLIPQLANNESDGFDGAVRQLNELQAVSYWLIKATAKNPKLLKQVLADRSDEYLYSMSHDIPPMVPLGAAYARALVLGDGETARASVGLIRDEAEEMAKGAESDDPRLVQMRVHLDGMELLAWHSIGNVQQSRRLANRMKASIAPMLAGRRAASNELSPPCPSPAGSGTFSVSSAQAEFFENFQAMITQLEIKWRLKERKPVPLPLVYAALDHDVHEMLRPPRGSTFRRLGDDEEKLPQPLSPSQFLTAWEDVYRHALDHHTAKLKEAAATVKCLLTQPNLEAKLAIDFVNKDSAGRAELAAALYHLVEDSGTLGRGNLAITDSDFRLLQLISVLQAHNGISAATARSVFPIHVREKVRQAEIGISKLERKMLDATLGKLDFTKLDVQDGDMFSLLEIATSYPDAYARYSELKQQSISPLDTVTRSLGSDEAAVLFSAADDKLLAVVVRNEGGTVVPIKVPTSILRSTVAKLMTSLRQPPDGIQALPAKFRADSAWTIYQQLFRPLEGLLAGVSTVYLVGGEVLAGLPFQTLLSAQPPPQDKIDFSTYRRLSWLGNRFAFVSLPSIHSLKRLAENARLQNAAKLWGIGEPAISGAALRRMGVKGIPETAQLLARTSKRGDLPPLLGANATYANFASQTQSGTLSKADIVLINSHALSAGQAERFGTKDASIMLAPSAQKNAFGADLLTTSQVVELNLSVRLTMLMACETAGGTADDRTQPFAGLVNAFFYSGADTVLATAQPVNSAISEELAVEFLHGVRDNGMSSAKALQRAVAEVRCPDDASPCAASDKYVWAHPAYWSHFMLVGSGR